MKTEAAEALSSLFRDIVCECINLDILVGDFALLKPNLKFRTREFLAMARGNKFFDKGVEAVRMILK
jgi:hypothetical protein